MITFITKLLEAINDEYLITKLLGDKHSFLQEDTICHFAIKKSSWKIAELLIKNNANLKKPGVNNENILHLIARHYKSNYQEYAKLYPELASEKNSSGVTPEQIFKNNPSSPEFFSSNSDQPQGGCQNDGAKYSPK